MNTVYKVRMSYTMVNLFYCSSVWFFLVSERECIQLVKVVLKLREVPRSFHKNCGSFIFVSGFSEYFYFPVKVCDYSYIYEHKKYK